MGFFQKLGGAVKKLARSKIVQGALNTSTGGLSGKAISVAKGIGAAMKGGKAMRKQNKSIVMHLAKQASPPAIVPDIQPLQVRDMTPSSAPRRKPSKKLKAALARVKKRANRKYPGDTMSSNEYRKSLRKKYGVKRPPPKGGLDLKAMAKEWRAAGKPGDWRSWIKNNPIRNK